MLFEQEGSNLYCEMFVVIDLASKSLVVRFMRFLNSNRHLSLSNFSNNFTNEHRRHIFFVENYLSLTFLNGFHSTFTLSTR